MNNDSMNIIILCGTFDDNYTPLTRAAFWKLYHKFGDSVENVMESGEEKVQELLKRSASVAFALERLQQMGIRIATFKDEEYPSRLFSKLKDFCPPLFYYCGDVAIKNMKFAGYVGSRSIDDKDAGWTKKMIDKNIRGGYGIVTGGARGIDETALCHAINAGGKAVVFLPDNMNVKLKDAFYQQNIREGKILVYSHFSPFAKKMRNSFVAAAMERNKYIYAMSAATAVVKSDLNKGGTWSGATEAIKHNWANVFVWDNKEYAGNQKLVELGAIPLSDDGERVKPDGTIDVKQKTEKEPDSEQISLFGDEAV